MKLISILIVLALEYYLQAGKRLNRFTWFDGYALSLQNTISKAAVWAGASGVALLQLPLLLGAFLAYYFFGHWLFGLVALVLNVFLLLYCIGPLELQSLVTSYCDNPSDTKKASLLIGDAAPTDANERARAVSHGILCRANDNLFAMIVWFVILGPLGALLYRSAVLIKEISKNDDSSLHALHQIAKRWQLILDWIPVRITSISYALMGNFLHGSKVWLKHVGRGLQNNDAQLIECGMVSLGIDQANTQLANEDENRHVFALVQRALVLIVVIVAVFTIGGWIY